MEKWPGIIVKGVQGGQGWTENAIPCSEWQRPQGI